MLALPLLLALAVTADPAAAPAEPAAPAAPAALAAGEDEDEGPQVNVAPPDGPAAPAAPAAPYLVTGHLEPEQVVVGATARLGASSRGLDGGVDATIRHLGFEAGVTLGGAERLGGSDGRTGVRALGLLAGYGLQRGRYRGEVLLGWGLASDVVKSSGASATRSGHFRSAQLGVDRAVAGGEGWRATLGLGLWYRDVFGLAGAPTGHGDLGGGLRLGVEAGW